MYLRNYGTIVGFLAALCTGISNGTHEENVQNAFNRVEHIVQRLETKNANLRPDFEKLIKETTTEINQFSQHKINQIVHLMKCKLAQPACDWARNEAEAKQALKDPRYKHFIKMNHECSKNDWVTLLPTCKENCKEILLELVLLYIFEKQIKE